MSGNSVSMNNEITCITEGAYPDALTYGVKYKVIALDEQKQQVKIRGDNERERWYPSACFDMSGAEVVRLVRILHHDSIEEALDWVEVKVEFSNGQHRWCFFITPELLLRASKNMVYQSMRLLSYDAPHMIVVSAVSKEMIEQTHAFIERQGALLACTKPME